MIQITVNLPEKKLVTIETVVHGDCFLFEEQLYMKLGGSDRQEYTALNLHEGICYHIPYGHKVQPMDVTMEATVK